jgi:hypothetical protein
MGKGRMIPYATSKKGIVNSLRTWKTLNGHTNDCWAVSISLATGVDYNYIREYAKSIRALTPEDRIYMHYDRILINRLGFATRQFYNVTFDEETTVRELVKSLDKDKKVILWCTYWDKEIGVEIRHLIYSTNNEIWDDKRNRVGWKVNIAMEIIDLGEE